MENLLNECFKPFWFITSTDKQTFIESGEEEQKRILFSHVILSLIDKYDKLVLLSEGNYDD